MGTSNGEEMNGFVWSLMSTEGGGFIEGTAVTDVISMKNGILKGTLQERKGTLENYEFFREQFVESSNNLFIFPDLSKSSVLYKRGTPVKVFARQIWGEILDEPILGVVYQNQVDTNGYGCSGSVIVSVDPRHFRRQVINSVGGMTVEVYPQQLRYCYHTNKYPIAGSGQAKYCNGGFVPHKMFRETFFSKMKKRVDSWLESV